MALDSKDTIFAIATPPGVGGIGVLRVSGTAVEDIAQQLLGSVPAPRRATFTHFRDELGQSIDTGLAVYFPAPNSLTGEDVIEFQGHGGPVVQQLLGDRVAQLGARPARPGEFLERAFLNDKMDLTQAEAVADLIESGTAAAARAAQRSMQGALSKRVEALQEQLISLRVYVEAALDFPEEEIDFIADSDVAERLSRLTDKLGRLRAEAEQGRLLRDGITLAIFGQPNAGKSSLMNALAGRDSAIVTNMPGTTRDVLREVVSLDGLPVHIADTAGIREAADEVEAEGVRRARSELQSCDLALLVIDLTDEIEDQQALANEVPQGVRCIKVFNKIDLVSHPARGADEEQQAWISAKTGAGINGLVSLIKGGAGLATGAGGSFSARTRHLDVLRRVQEHLESGRSRLDSPEVLAEELRLAHRALGEITGDYLPDDLLGAIFSSFCIGK